MMGLRGEMQNERIRTSRKDAEMVKKVKTSCLPPPGLRKKPLKIEEFSELIQESRKYAREFGLKKDDVKEVIKKVRRENRT
jgi:pantoate kinase